VEVKLLGGMPSLLAVGPSGVRYQLQHAFCSMEAAERLADKVRSKATIDPSLWTAVGTVAGSAADVALRAEAISEQLYRERYEAERVAA